MGVRSRRKWEIRCRIEGDIVFARPGFYFGIKIRCTLNYANSCKCWFIYLCKFTPTRYSECNYLLSKIHRHDWHGFTPVHTESRKMWNWVRLPVCLSDVSRYISANCRQKSQFAKNSRCWTRLMRCHHIYVSTILHISHIRTYSSTSGPSQFWLGLMVHAGMTWQQSYMIYEGWQ